MSIETITKRILDEANAYADGCKNDAKAQNESLLSETRNEASKILDDAKARAEKDCKLLIERRESVAGLESRKMQLTAKQELIQESFDQAFNKMQNLSDDEYYNFLGKQLSAYEKQGGEIQLNEKDLKKFGARLSQDYKGMFTVSNEPINVGGGFLLKQDSIFINASIEKLVADQKDKMTSDIAKVLFP